MNTIELVESLRSDQCPACAAAKRNRQSFCGRCYMTLPQSMRTSLYKRIGFGYSEAMAAAMDYLQNKEQPHE